jgi:serine O-acetyltransferase
LGATTDPGRPVPFLPAFRADILAHVPPERTGGSRVGWWMSLASTAVRSSGFHVATLYRLAHLSRGRGGWPGRALAATLFWFVRHSYGCSIAPTARIHGGLILPHPQGIVIGAGAVLGPRCWVFQNVTVGGAPGRTGLPTVGADCRLFAGAVLVGPIRVGDRAVVGANAVVHRDVPPGASVRPAPVIYDPPP